MVVSHYRMCTPYKSREEHSISQAVTVTLPVAEGWGTQLLSPSTLPIFLHHFVKRCLPRFLPLAPSSTTGLHSFILNIKAQSGHLLYTNHNSVKCKAIREWVQMQEIL